MTITPIAVHLDYDEPDSGFLFTLGAYGLTKVAILGLGLSADDAVELMLEWCDDNAPGLLCEPDYGEAARELGVPWPMPEEGRDIERVLERAETDLIVCGHTTLRNGSAIPAWEVHFDELSPEEVSDYAEHEKGITP
jgi:hypothetical protein